MEPLKITFFLRTPIALGYPFIFFDSLIAHVLVKETLGEDYYSLPSKVPARKVLDVFSKPFVPLKRWRDLYVASVAVFDEERQYAFSYFKKGDFKDFARGKIRRGSGFFKDFNLKVVYVPCRTVTFYATGFRDEVEKLVGKVRFIGKDRNIGFGAVKKVVVEEADGEYGLVKDGVCMRPIPVRYLDYWEDAAYMSYKPPYWCKESIDLCSVPFTRVRLK